MAGSLADRGHECVIFCPGELGDQSVEIFEDGRIVRRCRPNGGPVDRLLHLPVPCSAPWAAWFLAKFRQENIDLVIVRDLRLSLPAIWAARRRSIQAILDIAEHYPGLMKIVHRPGFAASLYRRPAFIAWLERATVRRADVVWVVCEENVDRLAPHNSRIQVINNYPLKADIATDCSSQHRGYSEQGEPVRVIFLGLIDEIRGLELAIDGFSLLVARLPNTRLVIFGDAGEMPALAKQTEAKGLTGKIEFRGPVSPKWRYHAMSEGDVGIILHRVCDLTQHTVPNKLFDYMSVGLPIVATPLKPVARVIEREGCGLIVEENPQSVADGLRDLILDPVRRQAMGTAGQRAVGERYHWEDEAAKIEGTLFGLSRPGERGLSRRRGSRDEIPW